MCFSGSNIGHKHAHTNSEDKWKLLIQLNPKVFFSCCKKCEDEKERKEKKRKREQKNSSEGIGRYSKLKGSINKKRAAIAYRNHYVYRLHTRSQHNNIFTHSPCTCIGMRLDPISRPSIFPTVRFGCVFIMLPPLSTVPL